MTYGYRRRHNYIVRSLHHTSCRQYIHINLSVDGFICSQHTKLSFLIYLSESRRLCQFPLTPALRNLGSLHHTNCRQYLHINLSVDGFICSQHTKLSFLCCLIYLSESRRLLSRLLGSIPTYTSFGKSRVG